MSLRFAGLRATTPDHNRFLFGGIVFLWGAHAPRVLASAPRHRELLRRGKTLSGEAPKTLRQARAVPRLVIPNRVDGEGPLTP